MNEIKNDVAQPIKEDWFKKNLGTILLVPFILFVILGIMAICGSMTATV